MHSPSLDQSKLFFQSGFCETKTPLEAKVARGTADRDPEIAFLRNPALLIRVIEREGAALDRAQSKRRSSEDSLFRNLP